MKTIYFILLGCLLMAGEVYAQPLKAAIGIEKTVAGTQYGFGLVLQSKRHWQWGGFYQASLNYTRDGGQLVNPFYGITLSAPLAKADRLTFYANARCGVVNEIFIAVVPGLETELQLSKKISFSALMSVRMSYPSAQLKMTFSL
ncbi:MAG: hypothetical protein HYZ44_11050 [Bacteroidetes bacterium]|nr:hypothetical protein [Bacteroidota bacterium]